MDATRILQTVTDVGLQVGLRVLGAIVVFIAGRQLIDLGLRLISRALTRQDVDPTLLRYVGNFVAAALNIALVVAILGYFGVETTTFAALVAAVGVAVGMAWSGLLAHFAAEERLAKIPTVKADPPPDVELVGATLAGPQFAVRPYCHNDHYWQVYFDAMRAVAAAFGEAGFPAPAAIVATRAA